MESLIAWLLVTFNFFASGLGILTIAGITVVMLLFWEWRTLLIGLCVIQLGIVVLVTRVHQVNLEWGQVQLLVTLLSVGMLGLSAQQIRFAIPYQRPGAWFVRVMSVALLLICWQLFDFDLALPTISPPLTQIFLWLALCALIMLGLGDTPLFTGVALLLWFIPVQAFIQILLPEFRLFVLIGMIQLLTALACSYLMLTARLPVLESAAAPTDIAFSSTAPPMHALQAPNPLPGQQPAQPSAQPSSQPPTQSSPRRLPIGNPQPPLTPPISGETPVAPRKAS